MNKCENCYHAEVCGNYPNTGLPEKSRQRLLNKGCEHYKDKSLIAEIACRVGEVVYINGEAVEISFIRIEKEVYYCIQFNCENYDCSACPFFEEVVSWEGEHDCKTDGYLEFTTNDIGKTVFLSLEDGKRVGEIQ